VELKGEKIKKLHLSNIVVFNSPTSSVESYLKWTGCDVVTTCVIELLPMSFTMQELLSGCLIKSTYYMVLWNPEKWQLSS